MRNIRTALVCVVVTIAISTHVQCSRDSSIDISESDVLSTGRKLAADSDTEQLPVAPSTPDGSAPSTLPEPQQGGRPQPQIVNGSMASLKQFPYAAQLQLYPCGKRGAASAAAAELGDRKNPTVSCGAVLILPRVLLSAGHCLKRCGFSAAADNLPKEPLTKHNVAIRWAPMVTRINKLNTNKLEPNEELRGIFGSIRHPGYYINRYTGDPERNDLSMMWFRNASKTTPVRLVHANAAEYVEGKTKFLVAGWGFTYPFFPSSSTILRYATVPFVALKKCSKIYCRDIWKGTICAGGKGPDYQDSCYGDSGGPLVTYINQKEPSTHRLAGLVSYGFFCANDHPGVYTDVRIRKNWIDNQVILRNAGGSVTPIVQCRSHVGHVYRSAPGQNWTVKGIRAAGQCCNACKVDPLCRAWSWHQPTKKCVMMKYVAKREFTETWTSGNVTRSDLAVGKSTCETEHYVRYASDAKQLVKRYPAKAVTSSKLCCTACRNNAACRNMSYNKKTQVCELFKGPSSTTGWKRMAWQYDYTSALVVRHLKPTPPPKSPPTPKKKKKNRRPSSNKG